MTEARNYCQCFWSGIDCTWNFGSDSGRLEPSCNAVIEYTSGFAGCSLVVEGQHKLYKDRYATEPALVVATRFLERTLREIRYDFRTLH